MDFKTLRAEVPPESNEAPPVVMDTGAKVKVGKKVGKSALILVVLYVVIHIATLIYFV